MPRFRHRRFPHSIRPLHTHKQMLASRQRLATLITSFRPTMSASANLSTTPEILVEKHGSKRLVTLNRPKALNALNLPMVRELYPKLAQWNNAEDVNMIIVKGAGEKAFCAGGDVVAVTNSAKEAKQKGGKNGPTLHKDFFREEYQLNHLIGTLSKPYVAIIDGIVMGGGCGLSVNGRFRISTERTMLAMPETALGLFPDVGGSYFLSRLKNNLGMYLALTGYRLQGADAFHAGIASHYVESAKVPELEKLLLSLDFVDDRTVEEAIRTLEPCNVPQFSLEEQLPLIRKTFFAKSVEGIIENLKKDGSEWSQKQLKTLSKMSPMSLKVTHKQITDGAKMSFSKIFTMEYRLTQRFMEDNDFHEGCRAILIDKDRAPKWKPATLEEVSDEVVEHYFSPLPHGEDLIIRDN